MTHDPQTQDATTPDAREAEGPVSSAVADFADAADKAAVPSSGPTFVRGSLREKGSSADASAAPARHHERTARMGTASVPKLIVEFAVPSIVGMLVNGAYNVIDSVFLGQAMGETGLSVATAAMPLMTVSMALAMLIGNGGNALAALRLGEGNRDAAERSLGNTVCLGIILAVIVAVVVNIPACMDALLHLSSATPEIYDYTYSFIYIICMGLIFQIIGMGVNNFIRTTGAPNRALGTMLIGTASCITLNYLFVMVLGWGVVGSALATVLGQAVSCACVLYYFIVTKNVAIKLHLHCLRLESETVGLILSLGVASFVMQTAMSVINFLINYLLVFYGSQSPMGAEAALASIGVVQRCAMFTVLPLIGTAVAIQPLLGYNYGAGLIPRVRATLGYGILGATLIGVCMWVLIMVFPHQIVGVFGIRDDGLRDFTAFALDIWLFLLPIIGFQIVSSNYFQATGQPMKSVILSLTRQVLFLIPLLIVLPIVLPQVIAGFTSLDALYVAAPASDALATLTSAWFIVGELRRLRRIEAGEITAKFGKSAAGREGRGASAR